MDSIAPIKPSTPRETVATREGNKGKSNPSFHVWMKQGSPASRSRSLFWMAAGSCSVSPFDRTTIDASLAGDCRMGRNIAGHGFSVRVAYFPSRTIPTTWMRVPSRILKYRPIALFAIGLAPPGATTSKCQHSWQRQFALRAGSHGIVVALLKGIRRRNENQSTNHMDAPRTSTRKTT